MLKKIRDYLKLNLKVEDLTETELFYATQLTEDIIYKARRKGLKTGKRLISITGERYIVVKMNKQYSLLNCSTGEISALVFDSLSELTLACKACGLIED